ncbi:MAG: hypothetical protein E7646_06485 [Ruminococcaceae bacterium]|nr:hypothetical protein [Oscillospiraceae bacterium]
MDFNSIYQNQSSMGIVEHLVPYKKSASSMIKALGVAISAIVLSALCVYLCVFLFPGLVSLLPLIFVGICMILWYMWRYVKVEYEYSIFSGELDVDAIFGQRQRKDILTVDLKKASKLARYDQQNIPFTKTPDIKKTYVATSDPASEDTYFLIFQSEGNEKNVLILDAPEKVLKAIRQSNPSVFRV